jgi:hypothetical protein
VRPHYYLDSSALNRLVDDPRSEEILAALEAARTLVSAINVVEIAATRCPSRRKSLLRILARLSGPLRPWAFPRDLLALTLRTHFERAQYGVTSVRDDQVGLYEAMRDPASVTEERRQELTRYKEEEEGWYRRMHDGARPFVQEQYSRLSESDRRRVSNAARLLKFYERNQESLELYLAGPFAERGGPAWDFRGRAHEIMTRLHAWRFYFGAMAVGVFRRSIRTQAFGWQSSPQGFDTQQAIYLPFVKVFVTDDGPQRRVFRLIAAASRPRRRVISYDALRSELGVPPLAFLEHV